MHVEGIKEGSHPSKRWGKGCTMARTVSGGGGGKYFLSRAKIFTKGRCQKVFEMLGFMDAVLRSYENRFSVDQATSDRRYHCCDSPSSRRCLLCDKLPYEEKERAR